MSDQFDEQNENAGFESDQPPASAAPEPQPAQETPSPPQPVPYPAQGGQYPQQPQPYQPPPGPYYAPKPPKDRSIAIILEILPGLFGFLGFGWIYAGNVGTGIAWLVGMLVWTGIATILAVLTVGISLFCTLPVSIGLLAISAVTLNSYTKNHPELFGV